MWSYCWCIILQTISNRIVICLPTFQMTVIDVPIPNQVPPPSIDSVEESCISLKNQHFLSPDVVVVEEDVSPNAPSSDQQAADTRHYVEEAHTLQNATQKTPESSDKCSAKPLRPPSGVELGIVHMPPHLQDKDPMWNTNEMRLLQKSD